MLKKKKLTVLSFALLLALLVAAVMPLSALAQDGTPPQPEVPVVVDEPVADEPAADEPAVEESVVEESSTEEITVSEILEKLPEDTALVVVDEEGEALSLASAEAAEVIVVPDPKFCPGTASFDDPLCGPVRATISEAVADAYAAGGSGTIYVEAGTFTEDVTIDGSLFFGGAPTNLTVWGAGSGVGGTTLNGSFTISNMNAFTLSGFSVNTSGGFNSSIDVADGNGTLQLTDLAVTNANEESIGIRVDNQTGNVNLTGVTSTTMGTGILINVLSGDVTLDDVVVTRNLYDGASVRTEDGNITVNNGDFSNNGYDGGYIDAGNGDITINDGNFSDNGYKGLNLRTAGSGNVSLNKVTATGNGSDGAYVNGDTLFLKTSSTGSAVNVDVICGNYSGNGGYGLNLQLSGGSAYLGGPILTGNTSGEYLLGSGTISFGECPKEIIVEPPVVVPQPVFVEENGEHGFVPQNNIQSGEPPVCNGEKKVTLKAGDAYGLYEKLCGVNFQLNVVTGELLPGVLPSGYSYAGGVDAIISSGGSEVDELPSGGSITLKFPIPAGVDEASLVVLFWNGAEWADVPGGEVIDGYYVVTVEKPGNYVLATQ